MIGNIISCFVFIQPTLRSNPCAVYFLAASLSNLIFLTTLLSPMLDAWNDAFNLISTISALCKFTMFIILIARTLASWFIVLATIDRYLVSSLNISRHRMSNVKQAYRSIIIICVISVLIWSESIYCFDANLIRTPIKCYNQSTVCRLYNDITLALFTITIPSMMMLIFGLLTIINIRQSSLRTLPTINTVTTSNERDRRTERILTRMLLTQVFLMIILNLPHAIYIFYLTITFYEPKTAVEGTINGFILNTLFLLPFLSSCISFFIYTLSGKIFREKLAQFGTNIINHLKCNS